MDWKFVDNVLEKYRQNYSKAQNNLKDELENELKGKISNLYDNATDSDLSRFKRFLERNEEYIKDNGYVAYIVSKNLLNRLKSLSVALSYKLDILPLSSFSNSSFKLLWVFE